MLKAVVHINFADTERQKHGLKNVTNILKGREGQAEIEVVCHGAGIACWSKTRANTPTRWPELLKEGVRFVACENTLRDKSNPEGEPPARREDGAVRARSKWSASSRTGTPTSSRNSTRTAGACRGRTHPSNRVLSGNALRFPTTCEVAHRTSVCDLQDVRGCGIPRDRPGLDYPGPFSPSGVPMIPAEPNRRDFTRLAAAALGGWSPVPRSLRRRRTRRKRRRRTRSSRTSTSAAG